jgi:hypothetical protein
MMKDLIKFLVNDIQKEHFTAREFVIYGVIAPVVFIAICMIA